MRKACRTDETENKQAHALADINEIETWTFDQKSFEFMRIYGFNDIRIEW